MIGAAEARGRDTGPSIRVAHIATVDLTHRFLLLEQLRRLREEGFDVTAISAPGGYADELEAHGIHHIGWPHATRSWNLKADALAFLELIGMLRRGRFDLVHTHNPKPGVMGRIAARIAGVPLVVNTVHGFYATREDRLPRRAPVLTLEWIAARFSDLELYQSAEDLKWARTMRLVGHERSRYLGNGVDLSLFDPSAVSAKRLALLRRELGIPPDALVVGTVGRMVAEKGYREFFAAARDVRRALPNVRFLAVGQIDVDKGDAIRGSGFTDAMKDVVFTGWRSDTPDLVAIMDVFVLASWREGLPRSAIEAAAMGKPLVLSDIRGCREVARDGVEGLLVPPRDPKALAEAIARLLRDPGLRARLGAAARQRALERFDEGRVTEVVARTYHRLLEERFPVGRRLDLEGLRSVRIRPARRGDAADIARLHRELLPAAFLPLLGRRFLQLLFRGLIDDPDAVAVVADRDGEMIGYAAGVLSMPAFRRRFLLRHGIVAAPAIAPRLLRPGILRRLLQTARYPDTTRGLPEAEWTFVGVKPGTAPGLGTELGSEILTALAERGADEVKGYVACDNRAMNRMVRRMGFEQRAEISLHDGRPSNIYVFSCRSSSHSLSRSS